MILAALALAQAAQPAPAPAQSSFYIDGNRLYEMCAGQPDPACTLYIVGAVDAFGTVSEILGGGRLFCVPPGVVSGQLADVLRRHMRENPETRHHAASVLVIRSLREAFPCAPRR